MKETVTFERAPQVTQWTSLFAERGWQIIEHEETTVRAKTKIGASEYPVRLATTWRVEVSETRTDGVKVTLTVPAFAESVYARHRLLETIGEFGEAVDGSCETDASFEVNVLRALRSGHSDG